MKELEDMTREELIVAARRAREAEANQTELANAKTEKLKKAEAVCLLCGASPGDPPADVPGAVGHDPCLYVSEDARIVSAELLRDLIQAEAERDALLAALHECYALTGADAGDVDDTRALVHRERVIPDAVAAMRKELDEAEADLATLKSACFDKFGSGGIFVELMNVKADLAEAREELADRERQYKAALDGAEKEIERLRGALREIEDHEHSFGRGNFHAAEVARAALKEEK